MGVIPAMHYVITDGFYDAIHNAALGWLVLMAVLYIVGAVIYAVRIPERIWPGRFDIWVGLFVWYVHESTVLMYFKIFNIYLCYHES